MNTNTADINFLPHWYREQRMNSVRRKRQFMLVVLMLVGMGVLWMLMHEQYSQLRMYNDALQQQTAAANNQLLEVNKLQTAKADLARQVRLYNKLARPVGYSQIINNELVGLTPDSIFLSQLRMQTVTQTRTRAVRDPSMPAGAKPKTVTETYPVITIEIDGYAPSDVGIANYIGKLAGCNLFHNVKMVFSREAKVQGAITRQFQLSMEVLLDRDYRMESAEEVANVDVN